MHDVNMEKFLNWFDKNRKYIGATVGCSDIFLGMHLSMQGNIMLALMWTSIGFVILVDSWWNTYD